jgi:hypothetical protein
MQTPKLPEDGQLTFRQELQRQRWDDHRYYHHSRVNQSLHLFSACSFLVTYVMLVIDPGVAALVGWILAMWSRQIGHFFFEPKSYDEVNHATHEHKEDIKIGYNLQRKRVLLTIWGFTPIALHFWPDLFGLFEPHTDLDGYFHNLTMLWLFLAMGALLFRTVHLFFIYSVQTGLVWATKILTDPFHDFKIYFKAPFHLLRGELIDPMRYVTEGTADGEDPEREEREPEPAPT